MTIAAVVIGRNEGQRLIDCFASLQGRVDRIVYVDSGSQDGSLAAAQQAGAEVVALDMTRPFTAARARNAGIDHLFAQAERVDYIQFIDGDCILQPDWIARAQAFLDARPDVAVVCGRRRERYPDKTIYNALIDREWATPVGQAKACGGDALMRSDPLRQAGGYNLNLIAGEEPELCVRLRQAGWHIWRLDAEMTLHDADLHRFGQWWQRARRAGHAYAEGASLHGAPPERHYVAEVRRALLWGAGVPLATCVGAFVSFWALLIPVLWPAQVLRLKGRGHSWPEAFFLTLGKLPEAQGAIGFYLNRGKGAPSRIIEYK